MMNRIFQVWLVLLAMTVEAAHAQVTAIKAGRLVDPETGTVSSNQVILVEGGSIRAVGGDVKIPPGAKVVDLSSSIVLPGLFDCHAHVAAWLIKPQRAIYTTWINSTAYRVLRGSVYAREMLEAGFTTIRNLSEAGMYGDTDLRRAIEEGVIPGPTMVNGGRFIVPYGTEAPPNPERPGLNAPDKIDADSRDELQKAIRENVHYGAKVIKIMVDDTPYVYSADDLKFVVEEAGSAGLKVAAHAATDRGAWNAAMAGVASIEHGGKMSRETMELAKKNGVMVVPTPFTPFLIREMSIRLSGMKGNENWRDADKVYATYVAALRRNYDAGLTLAFGSDVGVIADGETRGTLAISTIKGWVDAGLPNKVILQALTTNSARLLGVEKERGAIRPGLAADLIAVPQNPLENIDTLKQMTFVMKEGNVYRQAPSAPRQSGAAARR